MGIGSRPVREGIGYPPSDDVVDLWHGVVVPPAGARSADDVQVVVFSDFPASIGFLRTIVSMGTEGSSSP